MKHALSRSRLVGLFVLVFGVMAFSATAAQAELNAHWNVAGAAVTDPLNVQVQAELEVPHLTMLTKVGLTKVEILCPKMKFVDMLLKTLGVILGKVHYEECLTKLNGSTSAPCKPHSPGAAPGLVETPYIKGLIKLHTPASGGRVDLVEMLPDQGEIFLTLVLGNEECAIGTEFNITGKVFLKDCLNEALVEKVTHLWEEGPLSGLKFGSNAMTVDGSLTVKLIGPHTGMNWSTVPN